jgi:hypothetical protein
MHKVVVERPRWNPGRNKNRRRANLPEEHLPKFEGIKRPHIWRKGLTDLLGPLKRWLHAQVGRPWNDVYSEACAVIKPDSIIRAHVKTHLLQFVERQAFMHEGKVCVLEIGYGGRGVIPLEEQRGSRRWNLFFVHPETGLLCILVKKSHAALRAERRIARKETFRWLDSDFAVKQIRGIWFACQFREVLPDRRFKAYDHALGQEVGRGGLIRRDDRYLHCIAKRQLSRRELRRFQLQNTGTLEAQPSIDRTTVDGRLRLRISMGSMAIGHSKNVAGQLVRSL